MKRLIPVEWEEKALAKELLKYDNVKLCINCHYLFEKDGIDFCGQNTMYLDNYKINMTTCGNWKK